MSKKNRVGKNKNYVQPKKKVETLQELFEKSHQYMSNGNFDKARPLLLKIQKSSPDLPGVLHSLGIIALETNDSPKAVDYFKRAVQIAPDAAELWNLLGAALQATEQRNKAIEAMERAVALDPNYAKAHFNLANFLDESGIIDRADHHFRKAMIGMPDDFTAHITFAEFLIKNAVPREALAVLENACKIESKNTIGNFLSGKACASLGLLEEALLHLYAVVKLHPDETEVFELLGVVLQALQATNYKESQIDHIDLVRLRTLLPFSPEPDLLNYWFDSLSGLQTDDSFKIATKNFPHIEDETVKFCTQSLNLKKERTTPENFIALLHWGRSGSGFLHSLVDGHPQISTLPGHYFAGFFSKDMWRLISSSNVDEMIKNFIEVYEVLFDATARSPLGFGATTHIGIDEGYTQMGEDRDGNLQLDREVFALKLNALLKENEKVDRSTFFKFVHKAYEHALGRVGDYTHIFYHIHSPDNYGLLNYLRHFPETKLLMTVREPVQNLESWISTAIDEAQSYERIINRIVGFFVLFNQAIFSEFPSRGIRLEDLKLKTSETLTSLCNWLGVKNVDTLSSPTFQGLKWWGDLSTKRFGRLQPVIGFHEDEFEPELDPIKRKIGFLFSERDQFILETLLYPFRVLYGYLPEDDLKFRSDLKTIRPMISEPFEFETKFSKNLILGDVDLMQNASSIFLRKILLDRWNVLDSEGTYSYMIQPLEI